MASPTRHCPACGGPGRVVPVHTVDRLVAGPTRTRLRAGPVAFCAAPDCLVVYFDAATGVVRKSAVRVPIFQKESSERRPVCYCFEHCVADVRAATRPDGSNRIVDEIMDACRRGLDHCEETNPQGRCCLGNVRALLRTHAGASSCGGCS